jgi:hypothetical protein
LQATNIHKLVGSHITKWYKEIAIDAHVLEYGDSWVWMKRICPPNSLAVL